MPTRTDKADTQIATKTDVQIDAMIRRSWNTPICGRASPKNQPQVNPSHGRDGNWLSLNAKTDTVISGSATIASYTLSNGQYGDGTPYELRDPVYSFNGTTPSNYSARLAPSLVGMGLLEAISESSVMALADPGDADQNGISGRAQMVTDPETGQARLGRFGYKGARARVSHQVAGALKHRARGMPQVDTHLVGNDMRQGSLAQSRGTKDQDMVKRLGAISRGADEYLHLLLDRFLSDIFSQVARSDCPVKGFVLAPATGRNYSILI